MIVLLIRDIVPPSSLFRLADSGVWGIATLCLAVTSLSERLPLVRLADSRVRGIALALLGRYFSVGATSVVSLGRFSSTGHCICLVWPSLQFRGDFHWLAWPTLKLGASRMLCLAVASVSGRLLLVSLGRFSSTGHCMRFVWPSLQSRGDIHWLAWPTLEYGALRTLCLAVTSVSGRLTLTRLAVSEYGTLHALCLAVISVSGRLPLARLADS